MSQVEFAVEVGCGTHTLKQWERPGDGKGTSGSKGTEPRLFFARRLRSVARGIDWNRDSCLGLCRSVDRSDATICEHCRGRGFVNAGADPDPGIPPGGRDAGRKAGEVDERNFTPEEMALLTVSIGGYVESLGDEPEANLQAVINMFAWVGSHVAVPLDRAARDVQQEADSLGNTSAASREAAIRLWEILTYANEIADRLDEVEDDLRIRQQAIEEFDSIVLEALRKPPEIIERELTDQEICEGWFQEKLRTAVTTERNNIGPATARYIDLAFGCGVY